MPKYKYYCTKCKLDFLVSHSMKEKLKDCEQCEVTGSLVRVPSNFSISIKKNKNVGNLVESFIKEAKEEIKIEKENLKSRAQE